MAIQTLFIDGFDHYSTAERLLKWSGQNSGTFTIDSGIARNGGQALKGLGSTASYFYKALPIQARTVVIGFAVYPTAGGSDYGIVSLGVGSAAATASQVLLHYQPNGTLALRRASVSTFSGSALLGQTSEALPVNAWSYIELRIYIDNAAGEWEIRINGVTAASGSAVDTQEEAGNHIDTIGLWAINSFTNAIYYDDLYVRGDTVLTAGGFLGDVKVITRYPQGAGSSTQFSVSGAAANWQAVDENPPNGDTDYVHSNTTGNKDLYDFQALGDANPIKGVQLCALARKEDAGTRTLKLRTKSGATEDASASLGMGVNYGYLTHVWETNPNTAGDWTESTLDAAEFGFEASS